MDNEKNSLIPQEPLVIFKTEEERNGSDINLMSNLCDLCLSQTIFSQENSLIEKAEDTFLNNMPLIKEAIEVGTIAKGNNIAFVPDFDSLSKEIKNKLASGVYTIGESKQVKGNFRAVITETMTGTRVKDITLKKVPQETCFSNDIYTQMQLREINMKLNEIQDMVEYQTIRDRSRDLINPFLSARNRIVEAENVVDLEERKKLLLEADNKIENAIISSITDYNDTQKMILKILKKPFKKSLDTFFIYLIEDFKYLTKFTCVRICLLNYLKDENKLDLTKKQYEKFLDDFFAKKIEKRGMTMADILQNYYLYNDSNKDMWHTLKVDYIENHEKQFLEIKDIYTLSLDEGDN